MVAKDEKKDIFGKRGVEEVEANIRNATSGQKVVIWPFAMPSTRRKYTKEQMTSSLARLGELPSISLGRQGPGFGLQTAYTVANSYGDTFQLLHLLQINDLLSVFKSSRDKITASTQAARAH